MLNCARRDKTFPEFCITKKYEEIIKAYDMEEEAKGIDYYSVICKVGGVDKTEIGIPQEMKVQKDCHESMCNPILQAKILNEHNTDINVIIGLCVGHDSLFIKYSNAPVTTLITKDRVLGNNPAAALYTSSFFYKRLFEKET